MASIEVSGEANRSQHEMGQIPDHNDTPLFDRRTEGTAAESLDPDVSSWRDYSNCLGVDPDLFFPERGASTKEAKAVCQACAVREDCLEYAIANEEKFGIWGGLSERERRRIRRQRSLAKAAKQAIVNS